MSTGMLRGIRAAVWISPAQPRVVCSATEAGAGCVEVVITPPLGVLSSLGASRAHRSSR